jgi:hypothetical protein
MDDLQRREVLTRRYNAMREVEYCDSKNNIKTVNDLRRLLIDVKEVRRYISDSIYELECKITADGNDVMPKNRENSSGQKQ